MSGSSYSRSSFSGGSFGSDETSKCDKLNILTQVVSPTMSYFATAVIGDILQVDLDTDDEIVVLLNDKGDCIGSVNPPNIEVLIKCIKEGSLYLSEIKSISGANIRVSIYLR